MCVKLIVDGQRASDLLASCKCVSIGWCVTLTSFLLCLLIQHLASFFPPTFVGAQQISSLVPNEDVEHLLGDPWGLTLALGGMLSVLSQQGPVLVIT